VVRIQRLLVATDFGEAADVALAYGRELARAFHAELTLLTVAEDVVPWSASPSGFAAELEKAQLEVEAAAREGLNSRFTKDDRRNLLAKTVVRVSSSPASEIIDYATEHDVDLIVMGTHGRGPLAHVFMGSVAERVVRGAPCPVLTLRHPEHEFVQPDALAVAAPA